MRRNLVIGILLGATTFLGGCATLLPIAGAIVLKEAADRYELDQSQRTAKARVPAPLETSGMQTEERSAKAPEGSLATKASSIPISAESAENSAVDSTARILATAIKRVPTPTAEPVSSKRSTQE